MNSRPARQNCKVLAQKEWKTKKSRTEDFPIPVENTKSTTQKCQKGVVQRPESDSESKMFAAQAGGPELRAPEGNLKPGVTVCAWNSKGWRYEP